MKHVVNLKEAKAAKNGEITPGGILDIIKANISV